MARTQSWTPEVAAQLHEWLGICRVQQNFPPRAIRESFETPVLNNIQESILGQDADSVRNNLLVARERPLLSAARASRRGRVCALAERWQTRVKSASSGFLSVIPGARLSFPAAACDASAEAIVPIFP